MGRKSHALCFLRVIIQKHHLVYIFARGSDSLAESAFPAMHQANEKQTNWRIARSFPRFAINGPLTVSGGKLESALTGRMADIGLGGVCGILVAGQLRIGDRLQLGFALSGGSDPITLMAKLKYVVEQ